MFHVKRDRFVPVTTLILNDESGLAQGLLPSNRDQSPGSARMFHVKLTIGFDRVRSVG